MSHGKLNMKHTLALLDEVREILEDLDGEEYNWENASAKRAMKDKASVNRSLLYASHIADLARADIMSQYHRFKGEANPPQIVT
jgi:hypothetical protein